MNPAGISYLYMAKERQTALGEVLSGPPCRAAVAKFSLKADMLILDLTNLPNPPSVFDTENYYTREAVLFLDAFVDTISTPTPKDGREHVEYVPSQIVSEYFAQVFKCDKEHSVDGIGFPSAVVPNGRNLVLFPPRGAPSEWQDVVDLVDLDEVEASDWKAFSELLAPPS